MVSNEESNVGKEPVSEIMSEHMLALKKFVEEIKNHHEQALEKVADRINKENQQKFDQLSDRLQSIEASISKPSESKDDTSTVTKSFKLKNVFKNVNDFEKEELNYSEWEDHFNVNWRIRVERHNNTLGFYVQCEPIARVDNWSIRTKLEYKVVSRNQNDVIRTWECCYQKNDAWGFEKFLDWEEMKQWYLVDGNLVVEVRGEILETTGFPKEKIREFDESQKDVSDVILVVSDTKFYVSKMFLASQSPVFKALLLGSFSESKQQEVKLNVSDPDDFHYFLEVLYGESAIDDTIVEGVALLADMYDAPNAIRKCEEYLLKESKKTSEKKLEIATRYHLKKLEEKCMSE